MTIKRIRVHEEMVLEKGMRLSKRRYFEELIIVHDREGVTKRS